MNEIELSVIRSDYYSALADFGISHQRAVEQSNDTSDLMPEELPGVSVAKSVIDGLGLFAFDSFESGDFICVGRVAEKRTLAGRYTNHSTNPNAVFSFADGDIILIAVEDIPTGEEITVDYRMALALQIVKPDIVTALVVLDTTSISKLSKRGALKGVDAAAYDLLFNEDHANNLTVRERVLAFENVLVKLPQAHIEPTHEFIDGLYRREITIKKGTLATGKIHKDDHMDVILSGEMLVVSDGGFSHIKGPCCKTSIAGQKKAGYALTDCTWVTFHPTDAKTVEEVEAELFIDEYDELNAEYKVVEAI